MNLFNQFTETKKDNDLFNQNFTLQQEIIAKNNMIKCLIDELDSFKRDIKKD